MNLNNHLWSDYEKFRKSWQSLMNSDSSSPSLSTSSYPATSPSLIPTLDAINLDQMKEIGAYLMAYGNRTRCVSNYHCSLIRNCFILLFSSNIDSISQQGSTNTNNIYQNLKSISQETFTNSCFISSNFSNDDSLDRIDEIYDQTAKISNRICSACGGEVSLNDSIHENDESGNRKICNCFPKYPSQIMNAPPEKSPNDRKIPLPAIEKSCSIDQITLKTNKVFPNNNLSLSHTGIGMADGTTGQQSSEDEAEVDLILLQTEVIVCFSRAGIRASATL